MWGGKLSPYYFFILQLVLGRKTSNKTNFLEILLEHQKTYWDNLFLMMAEVFNFQFSTDKCSIYRGREILNEIDSMGKRQCCSACASIVLICRSNTSGKFFNRT